MPRKSRNFRPIVFISHSARQDDVPYHYLVTIQAALKKSGFDVLVDEKRLKPGRPWRPCLDLWMAHCHAAILLLSAKAVEKSEWSLKEATILRWRDSLERASGGKTGFMLFPVFIDIRSTDIAKNPGFAPLALTELQALRNATDADTVASKLIEELSPLLDSPSDPPRRKLEIKIASRLAGASAAALRQAADALNLDLGGFDPYSDLASKVAMRLLQAPLDILPDALDALRGAIPADALRDIFSMIPPTWVDAEAASRLGHVARGPRSRRAVVVNAQEPLFTGKAYITRALGEGDWTRVFIASADGGNTAKALERQLLDALRNKHGNVGVPFLKAAIEAECKKGALVVVLPPPEEQQPVVSDQDLAAVRKIFDAPTFMVCSGGSLPEDNVLPAVERLRPELPEGRELQSYGEYTVCASRAGLSLSKGTG